MQIVIEIDDKLYKKLQNEKKLSLGLTHIGMKLLDAPPLSSDTQLYNNIVDIGWAIKDSIPLPDGHGRLIDADEAIKTLKSLGNRDYRRNKGTIQEAEKMLSYDGYTPTIIEADKEE